MLNEKKIKVLVGLTNSADSKVAAYLLNQQGYEVLGITFLFSPKTNNKQDSSKSPDFNDIVFKCGIGDPKEIKGFCQKLGIQHLGFFNFDEFRDDVIDHCISFRLKTAADNPCFNCSKLTLRLLSQKAQDLGANFISTGHYAKVHFSQTSKSYFLNAANDMKSDQSFLLAKISQNILNKLILPLGDLRKVEVLKVAGRQGWNTPLDENEKGCLNGDSFDQYMQANVAKSLIKSGNIIFYQDDLSIGTHDGLHLQRFGEKFVGELYQTTASGDYVVVDINRYKGDVYIEKRSLIYNKRIFLNDLMLRKTAVLTKPKSIIIKIEKDPTTYYGIIHFKNNNSCLIVLEEKINKLFPSGTHVTIYEELIGGRLSVLGSGRVKYEAKFLEIENKQNSGDKKVADFEF
jgi:tRNA-uridine 2-sulfurtransferase